jgi:hypothetical protein
LARSVAEVRTRSEEERVAVFRQEAESIGEEHHGMGVWLTADSPFERANGVERDASPLGKFLLAQASQQTMPTENLAECAVGVCSHQFATLAALDRFCGDSVGNPTVV